MPEWHKRLLRTAVEPHTPKADGQKHKTLKGGIFVVYINQHTTLVQIPVPQKSVKFENLGLLGHNASLVKWLLYLEE